MALERLGVLGVPGVTIAGNPVKTGLGKTKDLCIHVSQMPKCWLQAQLDPGPQTLFLVISLLSPMGSFLEKLSLHNAGRHSIRFAASAETKLPWFGFVS